MTEVVVAQRMWQRRGTVAEWSSANPILAAGEIGVELPVAESLVCRIKTGNGVTAWNSLPYSGVVPSAVPSDTNILEFNSTTGAWVPTSSPRGLRLDGGNF